VPQSNLFNPKGESSMSDWRLTEVVAKWFEEREWEERPEINEEEQTSSTGFGLQLSEDFSVKCYFDAAEKPSFFKMYIYFFDAKVPAAKIPEVLKWINAVNCIYAIGCFHLIESERQIRLYHGMDFEDASFETQHISNIYKMMSDIMEHRLPQFMAICFGGKTAEEALEIKPE